MNRIISVIFRFPILIALLAAAIPMRSASALSTVRYAVPGALTSGGCTTWAAACDLYYALNNVSVSGDQVWVKQGNYTPNPAGQGNSFQLKDGVKVYGGFLGSEAKLSQRNFVTNTTILNGDIGGPGNITDNSYHVVTSVSVSSSTVLDGFTITNGNSPDHGGGLHNFNSSPTLSNLVFVDNRAVSGNGGGMYNNSSSPTLTNVQFNDNKAGSGGGMMNQTGSAPMLKRVSFSSNLASDSGGGIYNQDSSPTLAGVIFRSNFAQINGGGMVNNASSPVLSKVTFKGNFAHEDGGGVYNAGSSNPTLTRVIFSSNHAWRYGGGMSNFNSSPQIDMVSFSNNSATEGGGMHNANDSPVVVKHSSFDGNSASNAGGGIYSTDSSVQISGTTFTGNSATYSGGGVFVDFGSAEITNSTFSDNSANHGGALFNMVSSFTLDFVTISGNTGFTLGGAYYNLNGLVDVRSSILWKNGASETASAIAGTATMFRSILKGGCAADPSLTCTNVSSKNPLLKPLAKNGGFTKTIALSAGSPAIDTGACIPSISTDQRGVHRPQNGKCDMGAYEFVP